jgi:cytochrome c5
MTKYDRLGRTEMLTEYRRKNMKCIVFGCVNHNHQGTFVGNLCSPCHSMIVSGEPKFGQTFVHEMQARIKELESALRSILQIPNSDAAQGIMKAFAEDALGEET